MYQIKNLYITLKEYFIYTVTLRRKSRIKLQILLLYSIYFASLFDHF